MELKLKVLEGKHAGQEVPVPGSKFFIGRAEDCQMRPGSDLISRYHCVIVVDEGYVGVRDLGSKNGTYVNAERILAERELHAGDRLKVGPLEFEICYTTAIGGKKKPAVTGGIKEAATRAALATATATDVDVSEWLAPEGGQQPPTPHVPQRPAAANDTEEIDIGSTKELVLADVEGLAPPEEPSTGKTDPKAKKPPGKLPFQPQRIMAQNSRDAAAQVLEMMKKRR